MRLLDSVTLAQAELYDYLETHAQHIAPGKVDRLDAAEDYTYLSIACDDDESEPVRFVVVLVNGDSQRWVDVVTNTADFRAVVTVIRNQFDSEWLIADWQEAEEGRLAPLWG